MIPGPSYLISENFEDLQNQLAHRLALLLIGAGGMTAWLTMPQGRPPVVVSPAFTLSFSLFLLGVGAQVLINRHSALTRHLLAWSLFGAVFLAMCLDENSWVPFLAVPVLFASTTIVPRSEFAIAVGVGLVSAFLSEGGYRSYPVIPLFVTLASSVLLTRLTLHNLFTVLRWYWMMEQRADKLLEETRQHRAELGRALRSLEAAYDAQSRAKQESILARKYAEEARQMKERFAANISHELRTPLNIILGFSEIMHLSPEVYGNFLWPPMLRRDVHEIYRSSRHLLKMVDDILDLSRFQMARFTLDLEPTPLAPLLRETVEITEALFRDSRVVLEADIPDDLPVLEIDHTRIRQVILNLLNNARRFTEAGKVRLEARRVEREVLIRVCDEGSGIPADKLRHVFDEFYQADSTLHRKHGGAGLGLTISKHFVEAHRGHIWAESEEGVGSVFSFTLPIPGQVYDAGLHDNLAADVALSFPEHRPCVLVVDPDQSVGALVRRNIDEFEVVQVTDFPVLEEAVRTYLPVMVICNRLSGKNPPGSFEGSSDPLFVQCSLPSQNWLADELGAVACLSKPVNPDTLLKTIEQLEQVDHILIIDDERSFVQLVERILQTTARRFVIKRAYSGEHGLAMMRLNRPDVVLLDVSMPEMDGKQVLYEMKQDDRLRDIPVVLLTATTYAENLLAHQGGEVMIWKERGFFVAETLELLRTIARGYRSWGSSAEVPVP